MLSKQDLAKVFDTILTAPGMEDTVKIDLKMQRKTVLLLSKAIERGVSDNSSEEETFLGYLKDGRDDLEKIAEECLTKGGLKEFSEKLNSFL